MFGPGEAEKVGSCKTRAVKVEIPRLDPVEPDSKTRWTPGSELGREGGLQFGHISAQRSNGPHGHSPGHNYHTRQVHEVMMGVRVTSTLSHPFLGAP